MTSLSIRSKLFLVLLLASLIVVGGTVAFMLWSLERGFLRFVESRQEERIEALIERLGEYYSRERDWGKLRGDLAKWIEILLADRHDRDIRRDRWRRKLLREQIQEWPPDPPDASKRRLPWTYRLMLLDAGKSLVIGRADRLAQVSLKPIRLDGEVVGYLGVLPGPALNEIGEIQFLEQQGESFLIIAMLMVLLSAGLALPLAHTLVKPLQRITRAAKSLTSGRYDARVTVHSNDELGLLARDFNELASTLERTEHNRRQWVADISHELRTPLAVLRAELEALQDGVRPFERSAIDSLHNDTMRLLRIVEDLYQLSMADLGAMNYRKTSIDPVEVLMEDLNALEGEFARCNIQVNLNNHIDGNVRVFGDPDRLSQLFRNLLNNTMRYTESGGKLEIAIRRAAQTLLIEFQDSAPGVADTELPHLFERFYRVEHSRSRDFGGAGLGLALCRSIVLAHNGSIRAFASQFGGLGIHIEVPLAC